MKLPEISHPKFALIASSNNSRCQELYNKLSSQLTTHPVEEADIIICLGGDGFMLHSLQQFVYLKKPIYGINCGSLGFLMNDVPKDLVIDKLVTTILKDTIIIKIRPLQVKFYDHNNKEHKALAFNEASILRSEGVAAHLRITVDNEIKCNPLIADGALVATACGSLAYNKACGGPALPLNSGLMALTSINTFDPLFFKGATLNDSSEVIMEILQPELRKVNLFCDFIKYTNIHKVNIKQSNNYFAKLLFNNHNNLIKKIYDSQFTLFNDSKL